MKLKFRHKVFWSILLNSLAVVSCMLFLVRYYAHRNFGEFIREMEMQHLDELAKALAQEYRKDFGWDAVVGNWDYWNSRGMFGLERPPEMEGRGKRPRMPTPSILSPLSHAEEKEPPQPPRLYLLDAANRLLAGSLPASSDDIRVKPIRVEGDVVGWVGLGRLNGPMHPLLVFVRHLSETFTFIGAVALVLALLLTFILSRHLMAPLQRLTEATRALTSRRFDARLEASPIDEFGRLFADFNVMAQAMEKHEQMNRQWIADISHELRTPLSILRAEIEAMQDGIREVSSDALESLHFEVMHVNRIVQDLHDLSVIESGVLRGEQSAVDPLRVLRETLLAFATRLEESDLQVDISGWDGINAAVMADPDRLRQLFSNLLENTVRYVNAPGFLKITPQQSEGFLSLAFEDSGPGVPEESLQRLFDRLYRVDRTRGRASGGSGLGLAICKGIMESSGGRIEASNAPQGGLRILLTFPTLPTA